MPAKSAKSRKLPKKATPAAPASLSPAAAAKNFKLVNLKLIQDKLRAGKTLSRAEVKTLDEFEQQGALQEAEEAAQAMPEDYPPRVAGKSQAVALCRVTETQFDAALRECRETYKQANGQWLMPACWAATADYRAGRKEAPGAAAGAEDYVALKAKEEYERVRDANLTRRGQLLKKSEQLEMIAAGFAPIRSYLENGVNALAQKVAERPRAECENEIRKFFHTVLKQIGNAEFPPEIVETLLNDLKRSSLTAV